jgi:hypothetical protein
VGWPPDHLAVRKNVLAAQDVPPALQRCRRSRAADRESIHAGIRDSVGFGALGRMVFGVMEGWMVEELRAEVAARQRDGDEEGEMRWSCVMGNVLRDQGRRDEAVEFEERALEISRRVLSEDDARRGAYMNNLAETVLSVDIRMRWR